MGRTLCPGSQRGGASGAQGSSPPHEEETVNPEQMVANHHRRARGTGEIRQVGGTWKIRYTLNGRRIQERAGPRKQDAVDLLKLRLGQAVEGRLHPDAAKLQWADVDAIILDEHQQHRSYA